MIQNSLDLPRLDCFLIAVESYTEVNSLQVSVGSQIVNPQSELGGEVAVFNFIPLV